MTNDVRSLVTACVVAVAGVFVASSPAIAQPACPPATDTPYTGSLGQSQTATITIDLQPCEMVHVELQATVGGTHPSRDAQMTLKIVNNAGEQLSVNDLACVVSCTQTVPRNPSNGEGHPLRGTRGDRGLAEKVSLRVNMLGWYATGPVDYTMIVHRQPRPGYNIGGTTFMNAPLVGRNVTLYASLSDLELAAGQYYKFILRPGEAVHLGGSVTANSTYGATFMSYLYDANYQYLMTLADFGTWGTTVFPQTSNPATYTNTTGSDKTYYLRIRAMWWNMWDVQIQLRVPAAPQLKLFLDVNGDFSTSNPSNGDASVFLPGSNLNRISVSLPQVVTAIAAYVNQQGQIVAPPAAAGTATVSLTNVSAFKGIAMNASHPDRGDDLPDMVLGGATANNVNLTQVLNFDTVDHTARVDVVVWDYGGFATLQAMHAGESAEPLKLPADSDNNWIPDGGWVATANGAAISTLITGTTQGFREDDQDTNPEGNGTVGDGLINFEEYRGFMVRQEHRRTNAYHKDLFVDSDLPDNIGFATALPVTVHWVFEDQLSTNAAPLAHDTFLINSFRTNAAGENLAAHSDQRGIRVRLGIPVVPAPDTFGDADCAPCTPNYTPEPNQPVRPVEVFVYEIRIASLPHDDPDVIDDPFDETLIKMVTAHEVGHRVSIVHHGGSAVTPPRSSVMGPADFTIPATAIPTTYDAIDKGQIQVR